MIILFQTGTQIFKEKSLNSFLHLIINNYFSKLFTFISQITYLNILHTDHLNG